MKLRYKYLIFSIISIFLLIGCESNATDSNVFQYKDSYVGDNSAVSNIVNQLQSGHQLKSIELKTMEEPYGIVLNYELLDSDLEHKETIIYNSSFLFSLIKNVDWIIFNFDDQSYEIEKDQLQAWLKIDLNRFSSQEELHDFIEEHLADKSLINSFLNNE